MFVVSLLFPLLTLFLLSRRTEERFRVFGRVFAESLFAVLLLGCFLWFLFSFWGSGWFVEWFSGVYVIGLYAGVILTFVQGLLYFKWYSSESSVVVDYCWLWLKYCSTLVFFWLLFPMFIFFIGFELKLLEIAIGIPVLVTAIFMFLSRGEWPPIVAKSIVDRILGNQIVRFSMFLFAVINTATLWYFILIGKGPQSLISTCIASILGWITWSYKPPK